MQTLPVPEEQIIVGVWGPCAMESGRNDAIHEVCGEMRGMRGTKSMILTGWDLIPSTPFLPLTIRCLRTSSLWSRPCRRSSRKLRLTWRPLHPFESPLPLTLTRQPKRSSWNWRFPRDIWSITPSLRIYTPRPKISPYTSSTPARVTRQCCLSRNHPSGHPVTKSPLWPAWRPSSRPLSPLRCQSSSLIADPTTQPMSYVRRMAHLARVGTRSEDGVWTPCYRGVPP